jgi:Leucine-rich repeat (LRR) protein
MSTVPAEPARVPKAAKSIKRIILIVLLVPLIGVVALEANTLRLQQQTEKKRREIAAARGRVELERRVPGWLQSLAGEDFHSFFDTTVIVRVRMTGDEVGDQHVAALTDLPHLTLLDLENSNVTSAGLQTVAGLTSLQELQMLNSQVADLSPLARLPNLQTLRIDFCRQIEAEHLDALSEIPKLRVLGAGGLRLRDAGVAAIARCTQLEELDIKGSTLSDTGLRPLQDLKQLQSLVLTHSTFSEADLEAFLQAVPGCNVLR